MAVLPGVLGLGVRDGPAQVATPRRSGGRDDLEAVCARLSDLDPEAREHLLSDTEASLLEASEADLTVPLEVRLGPPERFAPELRAAAGRRRSCRAGNRPA